MNGMSPKKLVNELWKAYRYKQKIESLFLFVMGILCNKTNQHERFKNRYFQHCKGD